MLDCETPGTISPSPEAARAIGSFAAALKQAAAEFGGQPRLRHLHMLVQAGLDDAKIAPTEGGYRIETWEALEVREFSTGLPGYGMIQDSVNMALTPKGEDALDSVLSHLT